MNPRPDAPAAYQPPQGFAPVIVTYVVGGTLQIKQTTAAVWIFAGWGLWALLAWRLA